jgi:flavin reductase (DIM6/NTAB) family NADH-FMN oxidoreductase RutF
MTKRSLGAKALLFPTPVLIVGTYDAAGQPNGMPAAWGGVCSSTPPYVSISLRAATYSYQSIKARGCFTISIPSEEYLVETHYMGLASGRDGDKFASLGLTPVRAEHVDAPYVDEFPISLECKLSDIHELGSHTQFIGEVLDVKADIAVVDAQGNPDIALIKPLVFDPAKRRYFGIGAPLSEASALNRRMD